MAIFAYPTKTTDANGWTVYNHGNFIEYVKRYTGQTTTSTAGQAQANLQTLQAFPVGVAPNTVAVLADGTSTDGAGRWKFSADGYTPTSAGTTDTFTLSVRNLTTTTLSMTAGAATIRMITL